MAAKKESRPLTIVILSGASGRTCERIVESALAQFDQPNVEIVVKPNVRSSRAASRAVQTAAEVKGVVCHSIIQPKVRETVVNQAQKLNVPIVDVLGPMLTLLDDHLAQSPRRRPGLSYTLKKEHFDRIDAVDFTLEHDDGCGMANIAMADVVLVGVSRVSKSVTCFYLAYEGVRAANVPLVPGCDAPAQLLSVDPSKVIGLTMNVSRLHSIRDARIQSLGHGPFDEYGDTKQIAQELRTGNKVMSENGWRTIDVSYKSVEEVAKEIIVMLSD